MTEQQAKRESKQNTKEAPFPPSQQEGASVHVNLGDSRQNQVQGRSTQIYVMKCFSFVIVCVC